MSGLDVCGISCNENQHTIATIVPSLQLISKKCMVEMMMKLHENNQSHQAKRQDHHS